MCHPSILCYYMEEEFMETFFGVLAITLSVVVGLILFARLFEVAPKLSFVSEKKSDYKGYVPSGNDIFNVACEALIFRMIIHLVSYLMLRLVYLDDGQTYLQWWTKWDATNYIGIATGGYNEIRINDVVVLGNDVPQTLVFFPLYPFLVYLLTFILQDVYLSALVVSTVCFVIGCVFLYMAVARKYGDSIAKNAVILISVFPFSFFFGGMLPESTFFLFTAMCIYFSTGRKWLLAGIAGILCGLTRLQGILVMGFIGIEWMEAEDIVGKIKRKEWKNMAKSMKPLPLILLPVLGPLIYMVINYVYTGDFLYFMKLQQYVWGHSFSDVFHSIHNIVASLINDSSEDPKLILSVWFPQLFLFFATLIVILFTFRRHSNSMNIYLFVYLMISYGADHMVSGGRYMSTAIPLFIMLSEICERRKMLFKWLVLIGICLFMILMGSHTYGYNMVT